MFKGKKVSVKIIATTLSAAMIFSGVAGSTAATGKDGACGEVGKRYAVAESIKAKVKKTANKTVKNLRASYGSFSGEVTGVRKDKDAEFKKYGMRYVMLKNEEGKETEFMLTKKTFAMLDISKIKKGDKLTGFYNLKGPALTIYPPRYEADLIIKTPVDHTVFVGKFDKNLVSVDRNLALSSTEKTKTVDLNGKLYKGTLKNKTLIVEYTNATKSIPPQTAPKKIIVLNPEKTK